VTPVGPVPARRLRPGEYRLATAHVAEGMRFEYRGALYEITSEPSKWGIAWVAEVTVIEGMRPGATFRAMLYTTETLGE